METPQSSGKRIYVTFTESGEYTKVLNGEIVETTTYSIDTMDDGTEFILIGEFSYYNINYTEVGFELKQYTFSISGESTITYEAP